MSIAAGEVIDYLGPFFGESGVCTVGNPAGRAQVLSELNNAIPLLLKRLDSKGALHTWKVCVRSQTFTLPYDCLEPRQVWLNNQALVQRDEFYQGQLGVGQCSGAPWILSGPQLVDLGDGFALPYDWPPHTNTFYGLTAESDVDAGSVVHLILLDQHGKETEEDVVLLSDQRMAVTQNIVTGIKLQHKGQTNGAIRGSIVYPQRHSTAWIGTFPKQVITTNYRKKRIPPHFPCNNDSTLVIKGKLRYFPIDSELDPIPISDPQALGYAFQSLFCSRNKDRQGANEAIELAVNELEKQLSDSVAPAVVVQMQVGAPFGRNRFAKGWT